MAKRPADTELFSYDDLPDRLVVQSSLAIEVSDYVPGDRNLHIFGDELTLTKPISIPGKRVILHCRVLTCGAGASIDVSGKPPSTSFLPGQKKPMGGRCKWEQW